MKKRIVSLLLALVMAVSLLPVSAFAAEVDVPAAQLKQRSMFALMVIGVHYIMLKIIKPGN